MQPAAQALARSLKRRRLERGISLSELARRANISKATLSSLERGSGNPSVDTVWALAQALSVPFGDLFEAADGDSVRVLRIEDAQIVTEETGFLGRRLLTRQGRGGLEIYVLDLAAGAKRNAAAHSPGVLEHVIVVSGRAEVGPDDDAADLEAGDCLTFSADLPHHYHALEGAARLLSVTDYP
jgi:transcriptional regulator with XRE-family HTH domain